MHGIIEIWRSREEGLDIPVKFTVGQEAQMAHGETDGPVVKSIEFRETGAIAGKRTNEPVFVIHFEDTTIQRFVPARCVVDIAYESSKPQEGVKTPELEE